MAPSSASSVSKSLRGSTTSRTGLEKGNLSADATCAEVSSCSYQQCVLGISKFSVENENRMWPSSLKALNALKLEGINLTCGKQRTTGSPRTSPARTRPACLTQRTCSTRWSPSSSGAAPDPRM